MIKNHGEAPSTSWNAPARWDEREQWDPSPETSGGRSHFGHVAAGVQPPLVPALPIQQDVGTRPHRTAAAVQPRLDLLRPGRVPSSSSSYCPTSGSKCECPTCDHLNPPNPSGRANDYDIDHTAGGVESCNNCGARRPPDGQRHITTLPPPAARARLAPPYTRHVPSPRHAKRLRSPTTFLLESTSELL